MEPISFPFGLWVIDTYRQAKSELQVSMSTASDTRDFLTLIKGTTAIGLKVLLEPLRTETGQSSQNTISLLGASFSFDADPFMLGSQAADWRLGMKVEPPDWRSQLKIDLPNGDVVLIRERLLATK